MGLDDFMTRADAGLRWVMAFYYICGRNDEAGRGDDSVGFADYCEAEAKRFNAGESCHLPAIEAQYRAWKEAQ